jgi:hypothetical protein
MNQSGSTEARREFSKFEQSLCALGAAAALEAMLKDHFSGINQAQLNILLQVLTTQLGFVQEQPVFDATHDVYCLGQALAEVKGIELTDAAHRQMLEALINELRRVNTIPPQRLIQLRDLLIAACRRIDLQMGHAEGGFGVFKLHSTEHAGSVN